MAPRQHAEAPAVEDGLATLGPDAVAVRAALEERFTGWAAEVGAQPMIYAPLLRVADLDELDYFRNFPHLGVLASAIATEALPEYANQDETPCVHAEHLQTASYALPSAACFSVYLNLRGRVLSEPYKVTTGANCFRREDHYEGLRRMLGFYMREIVCVGEREEVLDHLDAFKQRIEAFTAAVGLRVEIETASDPFFDADAGRERAFMAKLFPAKREILHRGELAIASLNFHRNFFGERCDIRLADGSHAFSGCVAFGVERWIEALTVEFGWSPAEICNRIRQEAR